MCEKYLGLSNSKIIEPIKQNNYDKKDVSDELLESLLNSGNFGRKNTSSPERAGRKISEQLAVIKIKGFFSYFQRAGLSRWKLCHKYPALKPFAFLYGVFRLLVRGIKSIVKTGHFKDKIRYVHNKNKLDREIGIRTKETRK